MRDFKLKDIRINDIMCRAFYSVSPNTPVRELLDAFLQSNFGETLVIGADGALQGILTKKRLMHDLAEGRLKPESLVADIMHDDVITISADSDIISARQTMRTAEIGRLPVVNETGQTVGILTAMQICNSFADKLEKIGQHLQVVLDTIAEAVVVVDMDCLVTYWNKSAEKIFEISANDIMGKVVTAYIPDACCLKVLTTGEATHDVYSVTDNGKHVIKNAAPIMLNGDLAGAVCTALDITKTVKLLSEFNQAQNKMMDMERNIPGSQAAETIVATRNPAYRHTVRMAEKLAVTDATVLILGESGTGKEMLARAIHYWSPRRDKVFVPVNCAAIPASLCESEFFGYVHGAFTGAAKTGQAGKFELADGGTIFLDEIGELPLEMQAKLLRVLEEKAFFKIGGSSALKVDVRVIAATNRNLEQMVREKRFREDLYYRLNVFRLRIPPLRERKEDILSLLSVFTQEFALKYRRRVPQLAPEAAQLIIAGNWRGNIRELRNFAERLTVLVDDSSGKVTLNAAEKLVYENRESSDSPAGFNSSVALERERIVKLLEQYKNNKAKVARALNIPRSTLYYKMQQLNIQK